MNKPLRLLLRQATYNLRGGFLVRPLAIALALGCAGAMLSWLEETFPLLSDIVPRALFPSHSDPQVAQFIVTQTPDTSDMPDAPYKTLVVVQTNASFPSLRIAVECDGPITKGIGGYTGMFVMSSQGIVNGHPNIYVLTYQSATPPFGPANPLTFSFWSKEELHCTQASTF